MWKNFQKNEKRNYSTKGIYYLKHGDYNILLLISLLKDGKKNKVLHKKIYKKFKSYYDMGKKMNLCL